MVTAVEAAASVAAEYGEAAARWFERHAGPVAFRTWIDGDRAAQRLHWHRFASFGFVEAIAGTDDEHARAAIVAAVSREAGRHLYAGPLAEALAPVMLAHGSRNTEAAAAEPAQRRNDPPSMQQTQSPPRSNDEDTQRLVICLTRREVVVPGSITTSAEPGPVGIDPAAFASIADVAWIADIGNGSISAFDLGDDADARSAVTSVRDADGTLVATRLRMEPAHARAVSGHATEIIEAITALRELETLANAARLIGAAERVSAIARAHLLERRQFGRTLASFQALQHQAVDRHLDDTLAASLLGQVVRTWPNEGARRALLPALKGFAAASGLASAKTAVQHFGAAGFAFDGDAGLYLRHVVSLAARGGNAAMQRARFAQTRGSLLD